MDKIIMCLNDDVLIEIYKFMPYDFRYQMSKVSKVFYNLYQKDCNIVNVIITFYKNNKISEDYLFDAGLEKYKNRFIPNNYEDWNKFILYRYYLKYYPLVYFQSYPEFLLNKSVESIDKYNNINEWINLNLNTDKTKRKKSNLYKFFIENNITSREILHTGW